MSWETTKKTFLNLFLTASGFIAGRLIGSSEKLHAAIQKFGKNLGEEARSKPDSDNVEEEKKTSSLRALKNHFQKKEGFRK